MRSNLVKRFLVIDANSVLHRAFHALPPLHTPKGEMVNAVYGFFLVFLKVLKEFQPSYLAVAFDAPGKTLRHKKFVLYKAKREKAPEELYHQIARTKEALERIGIAIYEKEGYEADDCIGTLVKLAAQKQAYPKVQTIIVSGDQDAFQLIDENTKVYTMRKGIQDTVLYDTKAVEEKFGGLKPSQMTDFKALRGDPSDNIPGIAGIGEKTAIQLLNRFGNLEHIYESLEEGKGAIIIKPKIAHVLSHSREQALFHRELVTIDRNVPLEFRLSDLAWEETSLKKLGEVFEYFGFRSLLSRLEEAGEKKEGGTHLQVRSRQEDREGDIQERITRLYRDHVFSKQIYELEMKLIPIVKHMEQNGIQIDLSHFANLSKRIQTELQELEQKIYKLSGRDFNINSPQQLSYILFRVLQLPSKTLKKTPGGVVSTASDELSKLRGLHPLIQEILAYRELQKLSATYIEPLPKLVDEHHRLHTHFDQLGTATGRFSSSRPNVQNIPVRGEWGKLIRQGFVSESGFSFLSYDYSQMELRIAAHLSKDEKMISFFRHKEDIHRMTAAEVFGISQEEVTEEMRYQAKALNFGVLYGMGARGFAESAGIPLEEAESFIDQYFLRFPGIAAYIESTKEFARSHGYTETLFGRRRYIPQITSSTPSLRAEAERIAVNHPIQGTAADIIKMGMVKVYENFLRSNPRCRLLLQIHDELLFEIANDIIHQVAFPLRDTLEHIGKLDVPLVGELKTGTRWGELQIFT